MFNIFKKTPKELKFYDTDGKEIQYLKYFEKQNMLLIKRNGIEKIPTTGLKKVYMES